MSELREAAQAAVDAFNEHGYSPLTVKAIWALRDALAEDRLAEPAEDGWRRCAEGQGETQHCGLLEAAVLAEREACAQMFDGEIGIYDYREIAAKIRARGKQE